MAKVKYDIYGIKEPGTIVHPKFGRINLYEQPDNVLKVVSETDPHLVREVEVSEEEKPKSKNTQNRK